MEIEKILDDGYIVSFMRTLEDRAAMFHYELEEVEQERRAMRAKLVHYEKEHGGAVAKLRETEHKQNYVEGEIETMQKRAKELLKENRILQDEQRELELDIKEMQRELEQTEDMLEQKEASAKTIASQSAKMREKLANEARKKVERTKKEAENALKTRQDKLNNLKKLMSDYTHAHSAPSMTTQD